MSEFRPVKAREAVRILGVSTMTFYAARIPVHPTVADEVLKAVPK